MGKRARAKISKLFTKPHANQSAAAAESIRAHPNDIMRRQRKRCQQTVVNATYPVRQTDPFHPAERERERDNLQCAR